MADESPQSDGRTAAPAADSPAQETTGLRIVTAPMPKEIMKRCMLAPSMIARLLTMKYVLGVPFYRYEQRCAAEGFALDRGTMCRAICRHPLGLEGVRLIDAIFAADRELADLAPVQRKVRRDKTVRPLVDPFFHWARAEHAKLESRGLVATALGYSVRHEQALRRFLDDGRLRMDNNRAENGLRIVALGRKVFLFYGSDDHATAGR
jgi:hypothetical protein